MVDSRDDKDISAHPALEEFTPGLQGMNDLIFYEIVSSMKAEAVIHCTLFFCGLITWQMFNEPLLNKTVAKWKVMREARRKGKKEGGMGTS